MQGMIPVKDYTTAADMMAAHAATRSRLLKPANTYIKPAPPAKTIQIEPNQPKPTRIKRAWNVRFDSHEMAWKIHDYKARIKSLEMSLRNREQVIERMVGGEAEQPKPRISADTVVKDMLAKCAVDGLGIYTLTEILSPRRHRAIVKVRHRCIAAVYDSCYHLSTGQIGSFFNRDHSTIIHTVRKMGVER